MSQLFEKKGFTLIELLIVIAIIGLLSAFLTVNYISVRQRARDSQRKSDLRQLQSALELYRNDLGQYPPYPPGTWTTPFLNCPAAPITSTSFGNDAVISGSVGICSVTYLQTVPVDPSTLTSYTYQQNAVTVGGVTQNVGYCVRACLENTQDPQTDAKRPFPVPAFCTLLACPGGAAANYTLVNP